MNEFYNVPMKGLVSLFLFLMMSFLAPKLNAQIGALATCDGVSTDNTYNIKVTNVNSIDSFRYYIDNVLITNIDSIAPTTILINAPQNFVDGLSSVEVSIVNVTNPDSTVIEVHEALCIDADSDGDFDFNEASCDYTSPLPNIGTIVSTVAPYNGSNVYLYLLTDTAGVLPATMVSSNTGHFTGLADGQYRVYAYNFLNTTDEAAFIATLTAGTSDLDDFGASSDPICYNFCGNTSIYTISCACPVQIDAEPQPLALCVDGDGEMFVATSTSINAPVAALPTPNQFNYQWQVKGKTDADFANFADTDSVLNLTSVTAAMDSNLYRVIVTLEVNGTSICSDTSATSLLTVFPEPALATTLDTTVCSDELAGIILSLDGLTAAVADSFDIVEINNGGLTAGGSNAVVGRTESSNALANDSWTNITAAAVDVTYKVAPLTADGCIGDTITITLTVNPEPVFTGDLDTEVCSDAAIGITLPSAGIDSFAITASVGSGLTGSATTGGTTSTTFISNDQFNNISGEVDTVTYTVIPFIGDCEGTSFEIKVAIKPEPTVTANFDDVVCSDTEIGVNLPETDNSTNPMSIDSFDIAASVGSGLTGTATTGTGFTGTNAIASDQFTNTGTTTDSVIYTITPYTMGCVGTDFTITVRVTTEPVGIDSTLMVCSDEALSINLESLISNGMTGVTFEWYAQGDTANVIGETKGTATASTISDQLTNVSSSDQSIEYIIIPTAASGDGSCIGDTITITVTVHPEPVYEDETASVCSGEALDIDLTDNVGAESAAAVGFTYTVASSDDINVPAGSDRTDTLNTNITDTYTNTTSSAVTITYTVTPISADDCAGDTFTVTVTVNPEPVLASDLSDTVCSDSPIGVTFSVAPGSVVADSFVIVSVTVGDSLTTIVSTSVGKVGATAITNDVYSNETSVSDSVIYKVIPVSETGCLGDTVDVVITVDPKVTVEAGLPTTLCSTADVILADLSASISGGSTTGTWSTSGTGTFYDSSDDVDASFANATKYVPSAADKAAGGVTLTLTSGDPTGECTSELDTVVITINSVECSTFPWNGGE